MPMPARMLMFKTSSKCTCSRPLSGPVPVLALLFAVCFPPACAVPEGTPTMVHCPHLLTVAAAACQYLDGHECDLLRSWIAGTSVLKGIYTHLAP